MFQGDKKVEMIPLSFAEKNTPYFIKRIQGKDEARRHLNNLGFIEGEEISVINELAGNLIIAVKESCMAIDRAMAARIVVGR